MAARLPPWRCTCRRRRWVPLRTLGKRLLLQLFRSRCHPPSMTTTATMELRRASERRRGPSKKSSRKWARGASSTTGWLSQTPQLANSSYRDGRWRTLPRKSRCQRNLSMTIFFSYASERNSGSTSPPTVIRRLACSGVSSNRWRISLSRKTEIKRCRPSFPSNRADPARAARGRISPWTTTMMTWTETWMIRKRSSNRTLL